MAEEMEQSSESIATSEEFEMVGSGDSEMESKNIDMANGNVKDGALQKPVSLQITHVGDSTEIVTDGIIKDGEKPVKVPEKGNGRTEKHLKGEMVTRHPLASPVSPQPKPEIQFTEQADWKPAEQQVISNGLPQTVESATSSPVEDLSMSRSSSLQFVETDCTLFPHITYLGCAAINAPRSEKEIQRNMAILNEQVQEQGIQISLSVPSHSEGTVSLLEADSTNEIACFSIHRILFCARGIPETREKECFAFACSHGNTVESAIFQCHVFKCDCPETVVKLLQCFKSAFCRIPKLSLARGDSISSEKSVPLGMSIKNNQQVFVYETTVDITEGDLKGNAASCPREKDYVKLRSDLEKTITVTVTQTSNNKELIIQRCFGLLISPGRNLRHTDMHILEGVVMSRVLSGEKALYYISASWNPTDPTFEILNTVTPRDHQVYFTVAVDLVFAEIEEPVRFIIETKAKIFPPNERFWHFTKKVLHEQFYLRVKEVEVDYGRELQYDVMSLISASQRRHPQLWNPSQQDHRSSFITQTDQETESDNDEPLLSGTGEVSKECTDVELEGWSEVLDKWRQNLKQRPKQLPYLVRSGVPEALRGEIWPLLAGCTDYRQMIETYKNLISKDSACGNVIQRDINRTFPAHDFFRESGGIGQDSLYKICKAYSVYDAEIGYCQGLSFLAAALLLHMPEEQAFSVLVKIMFQYQLRDFFKNGFEELHLRLYQLEKLIEKLNLVTAYHLARLRVPLVAFVPQFGTFYFTIFACWSLLKVAQTAAKIIYNSPTHVQDQLPDLYAHFTDLGIETHMFASQWFLTLFTAKFPLFVVFYILDIFLLDGLDILFQVGLALLMLSKRDLLALDFEGVLKYFRVSLPKKYRLEDKARLLLATATSLKIKRLKKFAKEYSALKEQQKLQEDPIEKLQKENCRYQISNLRLEHENDDLANELLNVKSQLGNELRNLQEKLESTIKELGTTKKSLQEHEDEKKRLETEVTQLKELCRRELQQAEIEISRNSSIISEYKQICNQLNSRLESEQAVVREYVNKVKSELSACESCFKRLFTDGDTLSSGDIIDKNNGPKSLDNVDTDQQIRELELELAQTKLALVEAECKNQDLTHRLNSALAELQASKNTWLHKTWSSLKDVTKKDNVPSDPKDKDAAT